MMFKRRSFQSLQTSNFACDRYQVCRGIEFWLKWNFWWWIGLFRLEPFRKPEIFVIAWMIRFGMGSPLTSSFGSQLWTLVAAGKFPGVIAVQRRQFVLCSLDASVKLVCSRLIVSIQDCRANRSSVLFLLYQSKWRQTLCFFASEVCLKSINSSFACQTEKHPFHFFQWAKVTMNCWFCWAFV